MTLYYEAAMVSIAESLNWNVEIDEENSIVEFQKYSTYGQDFRFTVELRGDLEDFCKEIYNYYDEFDVSYETYQCLDSSGHGTNGAPYDMMDVYNDMQECENDILELWRALKNSDVEEIVDILESEDKERKHMTEYNRKISELLYEIENKKSIDTVDKAYDYVEHWCDNIDECYNEEYYYDFTNAAWGIGEETIIAYLEGLLKE